MEDKRSEQYTFAPDEKEILERNGIKVFNCISEPIERKELNSVELIDDEKALDLYNNISSFKIYTEDTKSLPQYIGPNARVTNSIINQGSIIFGEVDHSVLFTGAHVGEDSRIEDSVIMSGAIIGKNVHLKNVIVANNVVIEDGREVIGEINNIKLITK